MIIQHSTPYFNFGAVSMSAYVWCGQRRHVYIRNFCETLGCLAPF